jgi:transposase-like protein
MGKKIGNREEGWRERIAAHERSGLSVKQFCEQQQITEQSFYFWRKRLREGEGESMRFALVDTGAIRPQAPAEPVLELVLASGERLRIGAGADATTLRSVLAALRA